MLVKRLYVGYLKDSFRLSELFRCICESGCERFQKLLSMEIGKNGKYCRYTIEICIIPIYF